MPTLSFLAIRKPMDALFLSTISFLLIAVLYSSVGHAGASGYLAVMALLAFAPETIKPASLILNILVALVASIRYLRAGCFDSKVFWPAIVTSLPLAYLGGSLGLDPVTFKWIAGVFLILSSLVMVSKEFLLESTPEMNKPHLGVIAFIGAAIGFLSGIVGVGGGVFLSPILLLAGWTTVRKASGVAAVFILLNSIAGLAGHARFPEGLEVQMSWWVPTVLVGGIIGSWLGAKKLNRKFIIGFLSIVLMSAGVKFLLTV